MIISKIKNKLFKSKDEKQKRGIKKYVIYISLVLVATGLSLFLTLRGHSQDINKAFTNSDPRWVGYIVGVMLLSVLIDGLVIVVFMRLYTHKYYIHQGVAVSMIGTFYGGITPAGKGGQVMQAYTLKKQGAQISNAASLLVMYFILYHFTLIIFDIFAVIFESSLMTRLGVPGKIFNLPFTIPLAPLTIAGFILNVSIIGLLFVMSYSHRMHNFVMHYGIGLLARLHVLKNPDKTRESLRIQVENFKIELRRLLSNVRVSILIISLLYIGLVCKFSIPWFAGMVLNAYDSTSIGAPTAGSFWNACFLSCYHQMITGLFPIPGGAGVSELFFSSLFDNFYAAGVVDYTSSVLLIWRSATYYLMVLAAGFVTVFYKASPKEESLEVDRSEFVTIQLETLEERRKSSKALNNKISQMSREELQNRLKNIFEGKNKATNHKKYYELDDTDLNEASPFIVDDEFMPKNKNKSKKDNEDSEWRDFNIK